MNEAQLHDALGELPEELLAPVDALRTRKRTPWVKWISMAACLALIVGFSTWLLPDFFGGVAMDNAGEAAPELQYGCLDDAGMAPNDCVQNSASSTGLHSFRATVLEVHDTYLLVTPKEGQPEASTAGQIEVSLPQLQQLPDIAIGDAIEIFYDGMLQETFPARATKVFRIDVLE